MSSSSNDIVINGITLLRPVILLTMNDALINSNKSVVQISKPSILDINVNERRLRTTKKLNSSKMLPNSNIDKSINLNQPESIIDENLPESNMIQFSPGQATNQSLYKETRISTEHNSSKKAHRRKKKSSSLVNKRLRNFSASSDIQDEQNFDEKIKNFKKSIALLESLGKDDKKIVDVLPDNEFNKNKFPQFIPKNMRFKCFLPHCNHTCKTEDRLNNHISTIHPTNQYLICPHCPPTCIGSKVIEPNQIKFHLMHHGENLYCCQYCEYIDFNRIEMRAHMRMAHLLKIISSVQSNIIVIRQRMLEDDSTNRAPCTMPQWVCKFCSTGCTEIKIRSHILRVHNALYTFKCIICDFRHNDDSDIVFREHFNLNHPFVVVGERLKILEKITRRE